VSYRSAATNFQTPVFGNYVLSFLDLETLAVAPLSVFDGAKHINPVYDKTGEGIFFVSDADGFSDIYHLRLADGEMRRITRAVTGVSGITASSPAFSYSPRTDLLAFSVFHERGYIVNTAYPDELSTLVDVVADAGTHPGRLLPPGRPAFNGRVARYLVDPYTGLVADSIYTADQAEQYDPSLQLDYIGQPTIGIGTDPYGDHRGRRDHRHLQRHARRPFPGRSVDGQRESQGHRWNGLLPEPEASLELGAGCPARAVPLSICRYPGSG